MSTLEELKTKYPRATSAQYEPSANCETCKGTGEVHTYAGTMRICICTYVGDIAVANMAQRTLNKMARDFRAFREHNEQ